MPLRQVLSRLRARWGPTPTATQAPAYDLLPVPIVYVDPALHTAHANVAWRMMTQPSLSATRGTAWLEPFPPDERDRILVTVRSVLEKGCQAAVEVRTEEPERWFQLQASPIPGFETDGVLIVALDVTAERRRETELKFRAMHDELTGVYNRFALMDHLRMALSRLGRHPSLLATLFIDLDNFKVINDRYGHIIGDTVLATFAQRLQGAVRQSDALGRLGGDEFMVVCEGLHYPNEAAVCAERLLVALHEPVHASRGVTVQMTASVGIAVTDDPGESSLALIERADRALYEAKRGHGSIRIHGAEGTQEFHTV